MFICVIPVATDVKCKQITIVSWHRFAALNITKNEQLCWLEDRWDFIWCFEYLTIWQHHLAHVTFVNSSVKKHERRKYGCWISSAFLLIPNIFLSIWHVNVVLNSNGKKFYTNFSIWKVQVPYILLFAAQSTFFYHPTLVVTACCDYLDHSQCQLFPLWLYYKLNSVCNSCCTKTKKMINMVDIFYPFVMKFRLSDDSKIEACLLCHSFQYRYLNNNKINTMNEMKLWNT